MRRGRQIAILFCAALAPLALAAKTSAEGEPVSVAATVNGDPITVAEFFTRLQLMRGQDFLVSVNPPQMRPDAAGTIMLNALINERLILQWAAKTKDLPQDSDINAELETLEKQPNVQQALAARILTEDNLRYDLRVQRARFNIATAAISLTTAEVEAYYKQHSDRYGTPERWGLSTIRVTKRAAILKVEDRLKAGKPFDAVAKELSEDPNSKSKGGDLGVVRATDPGLPAALRDAIKKLKTGEVSPPVEIAFPQGRAWYFMRLTSREPAQMTPLETIRKQVERQALLERAGGYAGADKKIGEFRQAAKIEINLPAYQGLASKPAAKP